MTRYAIGLGSNLGSRIGHLRAAMQALDGLGSVEAVSRLYESAPVGGPEQGPYLNAVALLESTMPPEDLLEGLHRIEAAQGREREVRWGARTLDLDIIAATAPHDSPRLTIPHPRAAEREFVLRPLVDVWPQAIVARGTSAESALSSVGDQGVDELARTWVKESGAWAGRVLVAIQLAWFAGIALLMAADGTLPGDDVVATRLLGLALTVAGGGMAFVASRRLGSALTPLPAPKDGSAMVETGPYTLVRHPIYGGVTLFLLGTALILDSVWGAVAGLGLVPFFWLKSEYEERLLRIAHPGYREYRHRVRRRLIPFLL